MLQETVVSFRPAKVLPQGETNVVGTICHQDCQQLLPKAASVKTFNPSKPTTTTVRSVAEDSSGKYDVVMIIVYLHIAKLVLLE
jgi:hypothetical protein